MYLNVLLVVFGCLDVEILFCNLVFEKDVGFVISVCSKTERTGGCKINKTGKNKQDVIDRKLWLFT